MSWATADQTCGKSRSFQGLIPQLIIIRHRRHVYRLQLLATPTPQPHFFSNQDTTIQHSITKETLAPFNHLQGFGHFCTNWTVSPWHFVPSGPFVQMLLFFFLQIVPAGANYPFQLLGRQRRTRRWIPSSYASASCCVFCKWKKPHLDSIKWWIKGSIWGHYFPLLPHGGRQVAWSAWLKICTRLAETGRWTLAVMNSNLSWWWDRKLVIEDNAPLICHTENSYPLMNGRGWRFCLS